MCPPTASETRCVILVDIWAVETPENCTFVLFQIKCEDSLCSLRKPNSLKGGKMWNVKDAHFSSGSLILTLFKWTLSSDCISLCLVSQ